MLPREKKKKQLIAFSKNNITHITVQVLKTKWSEITDYLCCSGTGKEYRGPKQLQQFQNDLNKIWILY